MSEERHHAPDMAAGEFGDRAILDAALMADLERFVLAQDPVYDDVLAELRRGHKSSHWMWFVFPQIAGLGRSELSERYAIADLAEARAYLDDPVLSARLRECAELLLAVTTRSAEAIFGPIDSVKLRSSMTLFEAAADKDPVFAEVIERYFGGQRDDATRLRLGRNPGG